MCHEQRRRDGERQDRESLHYRVEGLPGGRLSGTDHGQWRPCRGHQANLFFTFFGLDAIHKTRHEHIKLATVGNPGLHLATWAGGLPGVSSVMTHYMGHKMGQLDIPPIPEFIEMIHDAGGKLYACKATVDMFHLNKDDFCPQVEKVLTVGDFYEASTGGQVIFT